MKKSFFSATLRFPALRRPFLPPESYGCPSEAFAYGVERTHELFFPFGTGKEIELTVGKSKITAGERQIGKPHPTGNDSAEQRAAAFMKAQITAERRPDDHAARCRCAVGIPDSQMYPPRRKSHCTDPGACLRNQRKKRTYD